MNGNIDLTLNGKNYMNKKEELIEACEVIERAINGNYSTGIIHLGIEIELKRLLKLTYIRCRVKNGMEKFEKEMKDYKNKTETINIEQLHKEVKQLRKDLDHLSYRV